MKKNHNILDITLMIQSFNKSLFFVFLFLSIFSLLVKAQEIDSDISIVDTWYEEIEFYQTNYIKKNMKNLFFFYEHNVPVSYWKDPRSNQYVKVLTNEGYDWVDVNTWYYFKNGVLFCVLETGYSIIEWYTPEELEIPDDEYNEMNRQMKTLEYYERKMYFGNDTCIGYLERKEIRDANDYTSTMNDIPYDTLNASAISFQSYKTDAQLFIDFLISEEKP